MAYVRIWMPDDLWLRVKELARRELRRPANQVVKLLEKALQMDEEARRPRPEEPAGLREHQPHQGGEADAQAE